MRSLAAFVARHEPDLFAVCEIDAGDALALATRFAREWAYRGGQALFWNGTLRANAVRDVSLPFRAIKPFDRHGLLRVEGRLLGESCALFATQFASERERRIPELRFARDHIRGVRGPALFFAHLADRRIEFADLGYRDALAASPGAERIYVRGWKIEEAAKDAPSAGLGAPIRARLARLPSVTA
jgi:hypothetical protein